MKASTFVTRRRPPLVVSQRFVTTSRTTIQIHTGNAHVNSNHEHDMNDKDGAAFLRMVRRRRTRQHHHHEQREGMSLLDPIVQTSRTRWRSYFFRSSSNATTSTNDFSMIMSSATTKAFSSSRHQTALMRSMQSRDMSHQARQRHGRDDGGEFRSFGFSGAGFLAAYHLGVAKCLQDHGILPTRHETLLDKHVRLIGCSAGALMSSALAAGVDPIDGMTAVLDVNRASREIFSGASTSSPPEDQKQQQQEEHVAKVAKAAAAAATILESEASKAASKDGQPTKPTHKEEEKDSNMLDRVFRQMGLDYSTISSRASLLSSSSSILKWIPLDVLTPGFSLIDIMEGSFTKLMNEAIQHDTEWFLRRIRGSNSSSGDNTTTAGSSTLLRIGLTDRRVFPPFGHNPEAFLYVDGYRDVDDVIAASILSSYVPGITGPLRGSFCPYNSAVARAMERLETLIDSGYVKKSTTGEPVVAESSSSSKDETTRGPSSREICWDGGLVNCFPVWDDGTVVVSPLAGTFTPNPSITPAVAYGIRKSSSSKERQDENIPSSVQVNPHVRIHVTNANGKVLRDIVLSSDDGVLESRYQQGYDNAYEYLKQRNMLSVFMNKPS